MATYLFFSFFALFLLFSSPTYGFERFDPLGYDDETLLATQTLQQLYEREEPLAKGGLQLSPETPVTGDRERVGTNWPDRLHEQVASYPASMAASQKAEDHVVTLPRENSHDDSSSPSAGSGKSFANDARSFLDVEMFPGHHCRSPSLWNQPHELLSTNDDLDEDASTSASTSSNGIKLTTFHDLFPDSPDLLSADSAGTFISLGSTSPILLTPALAGLHNHDGGAGLFDNQTLQLSPGGARERQEDKPTQGAEDHVVTLPREKSHDDSSSPSAGSGKSFADDTRSFLDVEMFPGHHYRSPSLWNQPHKLLSTNDDFNQKASTSASTSSNGIQITTFHDLFSDSPDLLSADSAGTFISLGSTTPILLTPALPGIHDHDGGAGLFDNQTLQPSLGGAPKGQEDKPTQDILQLAMHSVLAPTLALPVDSKFEGTNSAFESAEADTKREERNLKSNEELRDRPN